MEKAKNKFRMYQRLEKSTLDIYAEARKVADEIGIPKDVRGKIGCTGAVSGCPALLWKPVMEAIETAHRTVIPNNVLTNELRDMVKDVYGDDYDAAPISTCEAALWVSFDIMVTPPMLGRGDNYRTRFVAPYERHMHHQAGYGRPFPPKYKAYISDRGVTAGELGMEGKRQYNVDAIVVPLVGARYQAHGIKYHITPLLTGADPEKSIEKIKRVAELHAANLVAFSSLGYDTPGYGYGVKDEEGTPLLQKLMGELAEEYNVPYIVDNAWGTPFTGTNLRKTGASVTLYSMDKAALAPTSGLIIGKEEVMIPIRQALGMHGERNGTVSSYGKAEYVTVDAGKEAIVGQIAALKILRDEPEKFIKATDKLYEIVKEEFGAINLPRFKDDFIITKTYNMGSVEVNYEKSWKDDGEFGIPIFGIEDFYAGSDLMMGCVKQMGILPTIFYDGNIMLSPGLGTQDENGELIEENMRYAIQATVRSLEIICKYAGTKG